VPVFEKQLVRQVSRGVRAFLGLKAGILRDNVPAQAKPQDQWLEEAELQIRRQRAQIASKDRELAELRAPLGDKIRAGGVRAENIVWIFGTGRSGNTWLSSMLEEPEGHTVWREPSIGRLFGEFYYYHSREGQRGAKNYVLGEKQKETWIRSIRNFVLEGANGRFPDVGDGYLVIKEQVGSVGAPLLMEALPESRMVLLVRDPRDVVASWMDATRKGGWRHDRLDKRDLGWGSNADEDLTAIAVERANHYLKNVGKAKEAYDSHRGRKVLVRYEDLRVDTLYTMKRIYSSLGIPVDAKELSEAVEKHSWERVPEEEKGEGKFRRKAKPGGWREDLTPEQARIVEEITAPLLEEFYSA
jgi:hypothetical protein